ncbi:MAG TPA: PQQ-binding-like beta-propeller repeat protein [Pyrinomonadaceae bacterium]|jgi:outer membrane protein assembly factor BamB
MKKISQIKSALALFLILVFLCVSIEGENLSQKNISLEQPLKPCWSFESDKLLQPYIASDNDKVFLPFFSGNVSAVNISDGKFLWNADLGGEIVSKIVSDEKNIYVLTSTSSRDEESEQAEAKSAKNTSLRAIDINSGLAIWKRDFKFEILNTLKQASTIVLTTRDGLIYGLEKQEGKILWENDFKQEISGASISDEAADTIVIETTNGKILSTSGTDGKLDKTYNTENSQTSSFLLNKEAFIWGDRKGSLYDSNVQTGDIDWKRKFGGEITNISQTNTGLLITSMDNFIYMLNKTSGKIIWKRRLAARVTEKPFIKENIAVVYGLGESTAMIIELKKGRVVNSISLSDANSFMGGVIYSGELLIFPTLRGLYAFGSNCKKNEKIDN